MKRIGDLELEQDLAFERRSWRVQRVIQIMLALFVVAAIAGFFGSGPAARAKASDPTGDLSIEYPRFARRHGPVEMIINLRPRGEAHEIELWAEQSFAEAYRWESATPEPKEMELREGRVIMKFAFGAGDAPARIFVHMQPQRLGRVETRLGVVGGPAVSLRAFHYP